MKTFTEHLRTTISVHGKYAIQSLTQNCHFVIIQWHIAVLSDYSLWSCLNLPLNLWTNAYLISPNGQMIDMSVLQERSFVSVIYLLSHKLINEKFKFTNLALNFKIYSANGPQFIKFIFWRDLWKCNCNKWIRDTISDKLWNTFNCKLHGKLFFSQSQLWICLNFIEIVAEIWNPSGCNWIWPHYILITLLNYLTILCKPIIVHSQTQWLLV